jgi:Leucine-rich repeat (LRR) protein
LDVSGCTALTELDCRFNKLTSLDVSKNTSLKELDCRENRFVADALNDLCGTLHSNFNIPNKKIHINGNFGTGTCDKSIAENKGWRVNTDANSPSSCNFASTLLFIL